MLPWRGPTAWGPDVRRACRILVAVIAALAGASARADGPARLLPSAGGGSSSEHVGSHGWFVVIDGRGRGTLAHLPPRRAAGPDGRLRGVSNGVAQPVPSLDFVPRAVAAWEERAWVVMERGGRTPRQVGSVAAVPTPLSDNWRFEPAGRLRVEPALPGDGEIESFAGSDLGPGALIVDRAADGERRRLYVLAGRAWERANLPGDLSTLNDAEPVFLLGMGGRLGVLVRDRTGCVDLWLGARAAEPPRPAIGEKDPEERLLSPRSRERAPRDLSLTWERRVLAQDRSAPEMSASDTRVFASAGRVFVAQTTAEGGVEIGELTGASFVPVAREDRVGAMVSVAGMQAPSRVVLAWVAPGPVRPGEGGAAAEVREISLVDGRVEYAGPLVNEPPLTAREFQWLALGLVLLMGAVLLVVLRADPSGDVFSLPDGVSLAGPGRRVIAGAVDLGLAAVIAARLLGVSITELGEPAFLMRHSIGFVGAVIGVGLVLSVLGETLGGRSIGKLLTGCVVIDTRVADRVATPSFWQAGVRNLVKWVLSPAAALGLMEAQGRHRGDSLARTAVVIPIEDEPGFPPEE